MKRDFALTIYYKNGMFKTFYPKGSLAEVELVGINMQSLINDDIAYFKYEYNEFEKSGYVHIIKVITKVVTKIYYGKNGDYSRKQVSICEKVQKQR